MLAGMVLLVSPFISTAGTVTLLSSATLDAARAVTLADVADLAGEDARAAAAAPIISVEEFGKRLGKSGFASVTVAEVRVALARAGANTSRLAINGDSCDVRVLSGVQAPAVRTAPPAPIAVAPELVSSLLDDHGTPPIKAAVATALASFLDVADDHLRLTFEPRDAGFLAEATNGRSILARPLNTNPASGSVIVEVRLVKDRKESVLNTLNVKAEVLNQVLRLARDLPRRAVVTHADIENAEQWVSPGVARASSSLTPEAAIGQTTRSRLESGTVLSPEMLAPAVVVKRNDNIDVWIYQGNLAIKARATALKDGAIGDTIPARLDRQRATFQVRLEGERRGVVVTPVGG
jgi:flagella basal body P-ring formation protein FlgA